MKKFIFVLFVFLLPTLLSAQQPGISVGFLAGLDFPILQEDQAQGTVFGFKADWNALKLITVEPNINFTKFGDPEYTDYPTLLDGFEGSKVTSYGVNALLGGSGGKSGVYPYFFAGFGFYKYKRDLTDQDQSDLGYNGGLGLEIGLPSGLSIDVRGKLNVIPMDAGGSKKSASLAAGVNYYFGQKLGD